MLLDTQQARAILHQAAKSQCGLILRTNHPNNAREMLYKARARFKNPTLHNLQIRGSPFDDGNLLIIKKEFAPPLQRNLPWYPNDEEISEAAD